MIRSWPVVPLLGLILLICGCQGLQPTANTGADGGAPAPQASLQSINHIVFMLQENRSFDHYFGQLPAYWQAAQCVFYCSQLGNSSPWLAYFGAC